MLYVPEFPGCLEIPDCLESSSFSLDGMLFYIACFSVVEYSSDLFRYQHEVFPNPPRRLPEGSPKAARRLRKN